MPLPDNRIRFPAEAIDFDTEVGVTYQQHDNYPAPNQAARYDWARLVVIGLLSHQAAFNEPTEFRNGTLWFDLNSDKFQVRIADNWDDFATHLLKSLGGITKDISFVDNNGITQTMKFVSGVLTEHTAT